jgi:hypothetical protein
VLDRVVMPGSDDLKVLGSVVRLVSVPVVNQLPRPERAAQDFFSHETMLVDVSPLIGSRVIGTTNEHIPARRDCPAALPPGMALGALKALRTLHTYSI